MVNIQKFTPLYPYSDSKQLPYSINPLVFSIIASEDVPYGGPPLLRSDSYTVILTHPLQHSKGLLMPSSLTRRATLTLLGLGGLAALAACGAETPPEPADAAIPSSTSVRLRPTRCASTIAKDASSQPADTPSPSPTPTEEKKKDLSGEARLEKYEYPGTYIPATAENPAGNVPTPVIPKVAKEDRPEGFAAALAFFGAAVDYTVRTGDTTYLKQLKVDEETLGEMQKYAERTKEGAQNKTWYVEPNTTLSLEAPQPTEKDGAWHWPVSLVIDFGEKVYYRGRLLEVPANKRYTKMSGEAVGRYAHDTWDLHMDIN